MLQPRNLRPSMFAVTQHARYDPWTMRTAKLAFLLALSCGIWAQTAAQTPARTVAPSKEAEGVYPEAHALYLDLHQNPELSSHETQTAAKLAGRLKSLGYAVTEHVGGTGIAAILHHGNGPTAILRPYPDAPPIPPTT